MIGVLTIPTANQQTAMAAAGFFVLAAVWYVAVLRGRLQRGEAGMPGTAPVEAATGALPESV